MHLNSKKTAVGGVLMALAVLCIALSGILEFNTLSLLAAASFLVGVIIREGGLAAGLAFYVGAVVLGFLLAPQKLYCLTFAAMGMYILGDEWLFRLAGHREKGGRVFLWVGKFLVFNLLYLPALFLFPRLIFANGVEGAWLWAAAVAGQGLFWIYDRAYEYFLTVLWEGFRNRLDLD
ncbi:MAG: hypothetical protein HFH61_01730 [Lachnospiraceae bacterium]|nr:hypothetical protein [Lachnospiraceae bacterium]